MATTDELKQYYADLLILQYRGKDKADATIQALAALVIADQLPTQVNDAFDLDSAVGVQLDILGKYIGVTRSIGDISLSDSDYRILLQIKIISNSNGSSTYEIVTLMHQYFPNQIFFYDYKTMRASYFIDSSIWSSDLAQVVILKELLPYPMAVQQSSTIYSLILDEFFGFRTYTSAGYRNNPMNDYASYETTWPWLNYGYSNTIDDDFLTTEGGDFLMTEGGQGIEI